jgi:hypothetical protein
MLMATWAREVQGNTKPPVRSDRGTLTDFSTISTSLPFCDAMFVDNRCSEYLRQRPLVDEVARYQCRIFSIGTAQPFLSYLAELEARVPEHQRRLAEEVYGPMPTDLSHVDLGE